MKGKVRKNRFSRKVGKIDVLIRNREISGTRDCLPDLRIIKGRRHENIGESLGALAVVSVKIRYRGSDIPYGSEYAERESEREDESTDADRTGKKQKIRSDDKPKAGNYAGNTVIMVEENILPTESSKGMKFPLNLLS